MSCITADFDEAGHELHSTKLAAAVERPWIYLNDMRSEAITEIEEVKPFTAFLHHDPQV